MSNTDFPEFVTVIISDSKQTHLWPKTFSEKRDKNLLPLVSDELGVRVLWHGITAIPRVGLLLHRHALVSRDQRDKHPDLNQSPQSQCCNLSKLVHPLPTAKRRTCLWGENCCYDSQHPNVNGDLSMSNNKAPFKLTPSSAHKNAATSAHKKCGDSICDYICLFVTTGPPCAHSRSTTVKVVFQETPAVFAEIAPDLNKNVSSTTTATLTPKADRTNSSLSFSPVGLFKVEATGQGDRNIWRNSQYDYY